MKPVEVEYAQARAVGVAAGAKLLDISDAEVRRMIRRGELPVIRIGRRVLIPLALLDRWIEENATTQPQAS